MCVTTITNFTGVFHFLYTYDVQNTSLNSKCFILFIVEQPWKHSFLNSFIHNNFLKLIHIVVCSFSLYIFSSCEIFQCVPILPIFLFLLSFQGLNGFLYFIAFGNKSNISINVLVIISWCICTYFYLDSIVKRQVSLCFLSLVKNKGEQKKKNKTMKVKGGPLGRWRGREK